MVRLPGLGRYDGAMSPRGIEIERKFRLRHAPEASVLAAHGAVAKRIEQVYLRLDPAVTGPDAPEAARVRRTELPGGEVAYRRTTKRRMGAFSFDEVEDVITEAEWQAQLALADPGRHPVRKTRFVVGHGAQTLEIDAFEVPGGLVVVEVELGSEDEQVELPAWLGEWREVTGDPRYLNVELARLDAEVPPFDA
jgi:CYTH domain-containing protein